MLCVFVHVLYMFVHLCTYCCTCFVNCLYISVHLCTLLDMFVHFPYIVVHCCTCFVTFGVNQVYLKTPKRNKLIASRRQSVIAWARLATTGAVRSRVFSWHNAHFDLVMVLAYKTGILINKSFLSITLIQYCNEFH
jgi:hypothetical protein